MITDLETMALILSYLSRYTSQADFDAHKKEYNDLLERLTKLEADSRIIQCDAITSGRKKAGSYLNIPVVEGVTSILLNPDFKR